MVRVKVCGITNAADAKEAVRCGANALGFIFYKKSPRYISPIKAKKIVAGLPLFVIPVGVFVNEKPETIKKITRICGLCTIQLHGDESSAYCRKLIRYYQVIKAFRISDKLPALKNYPAHAFLFDTYRKESYGGSGKVFNWDLLANKKFSRPVILSGGLNPKNVRKAVARVKPFAVDVSSGVEVRPGKKSVKLLKEFFKEVTKPQSHTVTR